MGGASRRSAGAARAPAGWIAALQGATLESVAGVFGDAALELARSVMATAAAVGGDGDRRGRGVASVLSTALASRAVGVDHGRRRSVAPGPPGSIPAPGPASSSPPPELTASAPPDASPSPLP